jgi:hypothetical protein
LPLFEESIHHGNAPHDVLAQMLGDLEHELLAILVDMKSVQNLGQVLALELDYTPS